MITSLAGGWAGWLLGRPASRWRPWLAGFGAASAISPVAAAAVGLGAAAWVARQRLASGRSDRLGREADLVVLADLVTLGLTSGLAVRGALEAAAEHVGDPLAADVGRVLADADRRGLAAALADASGHGERLFRLLARAVVSGAPAGDAVDSFASERRHAEHAAALAEARRLPVRLLLPLALLILPGFVVLAVGPALLDALDRLGGIA